MCPYLHFVDNIELDFLTHSYLNIFEWQMIRIFSVDT